MLFKKKKKSTTTFFGPTISREWYEVPEGLIPEIFADIFAKSRLEQNVFRAGIKKQHITIEQFHDWLAGQGGHVRGSVNEYACHPDRKGVLMSPLLNPLEMGRPGKLPPIPYEGNKT
jgi:hypothetical protein